MKKTTLVLMSAGLAFAACGTTASLSPEDGGSEMTPVGDGPDGGEVTEDAGAGHDASPAADAGALPRGRLHRARRRELHDRCERRDAAPRWGH